VSIGVALSSAKILAALIKENRYDQRYLSIEARR
jgi:hypothetical protein